MNDNAKNWVKALRSGEYKQTTGALHNQDGFCCLGVACELAVEAGIVTSHDKGNLYTYGTSNNCGALPNEVSKWLGLSTTWGGFNRGTESTDLPKLNDEEHLTFEQIADIIESNPEGLFNAVPDEG